VTRLTPTDLKIRIALPKGRMASRALEIFADAGIPVPSDVNTRKLQISVEGHDIIYLMVKPQDVPVYVEYGTADVGVAGKDTILESDVDVYDALDLGFGKCRMVLAGPRGKTQESTSELPFFRLATKYPRIAERYFAAKGLPVEIIGLGGSVELACSCGLADRIVDLVETGRTLAQNGLVEMETLFHSSARLIVNRASHKIRNEGVRDILERLKGTRS